MKTDLSVNTIAPTKRRDDERSESSELLNIYEELTSASSAFPELDMDTLENALSRQGKLSVEMKDILIKISRFDSGNQKRKKRKPF